MPPRLPHVTAATVASRIELRPDSISLTAARNIYRQLSVTAQENRFPDLASDLNGISEFVQDLIDTPAPAGLVSSARLIAEADSLVSEAADLRSDVASAYDRFDANTKSATEALEIITAWSVQLEAADEDLRRGIRPAAG